MGDENNLVSQDEIDRLLNQAAAPAPPATPAAPAAADGPLSQEEIEAILAEASGSKLAAAMGSGEATPAKTAGAATATKSTSQSEVDKLLQGAKTAAKPPARERPAAYGEGDIASSDVELLLRQAEKALASIDEAPPGLPTGVSEFRLPQFAGAAASTENATLDLLREVELDVKIELGRTQMYLEDVLRLRRGSVVPLDKLAGDPVDIYINGRLIARGEVLVLNDNFCVRVAELIAGASPKAA